MESDLANKWIFYSDIGGKLQKLIDISFVTDITFAARKRSLRRLCFHWCLSVHRWGCLPLVPGGVSATPLADTPPPGRYTPWADTPSPQCMLAYGQQAGGTHPTGIHSCSSSGKVMFSQACVKNSVHRGVRCTPPLPHRQTHTHPKQTPLPPGRPR